MREKIFTYNNEKYRVQLFKDRYGLPTLKIDKKEKIFFFFVWINQKKYWWDYTRYGEECNPIEFAIEEIEKMVSKTAEKENYEKKLDKWFA